jgi:glycosyltransferase involved in cell wall biosynthesis
MPAVGPLVSIFMFVRNGAPSIRRAVDSVLAQTYPNIEFIIQDAASTDGTLEILESYGDRLRLISQADDGAHEGLWRGLIRCKGDFVGSCLSDEELVPDAVERAVEVFLAEPDVGAITGDALITDIDGKTTGSWTSGPFNLVDYLTVDYSPYLVSSFFRQSALREIGLRSEGWGAQSIEFELWCRLATRSRIKYVPGVFGKYASHPGQLSNTSRDVLIHVRGRMAYIARLCASGGFFDDKPMLRNVFMWGHVRAFCNHAMIVGRAEMAWEEYAIMKDALDAHPPVYLDGVQYDADYEYRSAALEAWKWTGKGLPFIARNILRLPEGDAAQAIFIQRLIDRRYLGKGYWPTVLKALLFTRPVPRNPNEIRTPPSPDRKLKARLYAEMAQSYEAKNLIAQAIDSWRFAAIAAGVYVPDDESFRADRKQGWADAGS